MTPEVCKTLLENGIFYAYSIGKTIQRMKDGMWIDAENPSFSAKATNYRVKPTPKYEVGDLVTYGNFVYTVTAVYHNHINLLETTGRINTVCVEINDVKKVKQIKVPHTFETMCEAISKHGTKITNVNKNNLNKLMNGKIVEIHSNGICIQQVSTIGQEYHPLSYYELSHWNFISGPKCCLYNYEEIE